jgi:hypothetical protein
MEPLSRCTISSNVNNEDLGYSRGKPKREAQEGSPTYLYEEVQITDQRTMTKKTALINHLVYPSGLV